jgi:hypothetical protein
LKADGSTRLRRSGASFDGSRKVTFAGSYVTTGGTGKLKGLKGAGKYSGQAEVNAELKLTRNEYSAEGEYWFEK